MRVKRGLTKHRAHKAILKQAKGYRMSKHKLLKSAKDAVLHAGNYALNDRRKKKSNFRTLWIQRINGALSEYNMSYNTFIHNLKMKGIILDRRVLSDIAMHQPESFKQIVAYARESK